MRRVGSCLVIAFLGLSYSVVFFPGSASAASAPGSTGIVTGDFDADGYEDAAIGVHAEDVRIDAGDSGIKQINRAGVVNVLYGTQDGLSSDRSQLLQQGGRVGSDRIPGQPEEFDEFGTRMAVGDLNGDSYDDLAVGSPGETRGGEKVGGYAAGSVQIIYGGPQGLSGTGSQSWDQNSIGIADRSEERDYFGWMLAIGNFGYGSEDDLAIGAWRESLERPGKDTLLAVGAVHVLPGTPNGVSASGSQFIMQDTPGVKGTPEVFDGFSHSLAAADFDGSGRDDLAIGVNEKRERDYHTDGAVEVFYSNGLALDPGSSEVWHQSRPGIEGSANNDLFGWGLTAGDFDGDGFADLAAGTPGETVPDKNFPTGRGVGGVHLIYGSFDGLSAEGNERIRHDTPGIDGEAHKTWGFGSSLTAGELGRGPQDDLVIGESGATVGVLGAGALHVVYGSESGPDASESQFWSQDSDGLEDDPERDDEFARSLTTGNLDAADGDDLLIGVLAEGLDETIEAGAMHALYSGVDGLSTLGIQFWSQDSPGVPSRAEDDDQFSSF